MVSVFGTPKLVSGYAMSLRDMLERNSIKNLIFFVWKLILSFLVKKYHFKGNGSFEQKDYSWPCDKVFTACQTAPDSERLWNYYQFFYFINFT